MDLQPLFSTPITEQAVLDPGYADHTNLVWRVRTGAETVVVRVPRVPAVPANPFWWGMRRLFGVHAFDVAAVAAKHRRLARFSPVPVPSVRLCDAAGERLGRPCLVVEHLPGLMWTTLRGADPGLLSQFGALLGTLHARRYAVCGDPGSRRRYPAAHFHRRLPGFFAARLRRFPDAAAERRRAAMSAAALALPRPAGAAWVMPDLDPTQLLTDGVRLTGLVDVEAYVLAPPALELVALELQLGPAEAAALAAGYAAVRPLPDLAPVRRVYRYLCYLLDVNAFGDLDAWLDRPALL